MKKATYFYVACVSNSINTTKSCKNYFRLYREGDSDGPKLVEQGLSDKCAGWEKKYKARLRLNDSDNPYPQCD